MKDRYNKPKKFRLFSFLYASWFAFLFFSTVEFVQAQYIGPEDAFTPVQITESALNTVQGERFHVVQQNEVLEQPVFVELPDELHQVLALRLYVDPREESILTSMPGGVEVIAKRTDLNVLTDGSYTWSGDLYATGNYSGDIVLSVSPEGEISGTIDLEGVFWQIHPLGQHVQMLVKINEGVLAERNRQRRDQHSDHGSASFSSPPPMQGMDNGLLNARCTPEIIRLLVLYTPAAAQGRNISSIVNLAVQETNEAYSNSEISSRRIAVNHIQQFSFNEGSDIGEDINKLISDQSAQNLRNQHQADIVILLTDGDYGNVIGRVKDIYPGNDDAYAIVQADFATAPDFTFAHEIGHIQGAQHHPNDPTLSPPPFPNAYGERFSYKPSIFLSRRYRSTIMAYPCRPFNEDPFCERPYSTVKHFSNPNVSYRGTPTGTSSRNNSSAIISTFAEIADYRSANELRASILPSGDPWTGNYTFTAQPCGGNGNYSYAWYLSQDPLNYPSTPMSTQPSWSTTLSGDTGTTWFVRLDVTDTQNQVAESFRSVVLFTGCDPGTICAALASIAESRLDNDSETGNLDGVKVRTTETDGADFITSGSGENQHSFETGLLAAAPNPFNPHTTVGFTLEQPGNVRVEVFDILGRRVAQLANGSFGAGAHQFQFIADHLAGGTYLIHMQVQPTGGTSAGNVTSYTQMVSLIKKQ